MTEVQRSPTVCGKCWAQAVFPSTSIKQMEEKTTLSCKFYGILPAGAKKK